MTTLHIVSGHSAAGSLCKAVREAGRDDDVLMFPDDLSCGPIDSDEHSARAAWWAQFHSRELDAEAALGHFWQRAASTNDRVIVWFSRYCAHELAFFLAWTDRLPKRAYDVIDVTGREVSLTRRDGTIVLASLPAVSVIPTYALKSLLGTERPITTEERDRSRQDWRRLRAENAPFRVVTEAGLISAPVDHFDFSLLAQATPEWRPILEIVHHAMGRFWEPYYQVGNVMMHGRVVALVGEGKLVADGDPWDYATRIRLPE